MKVGLYVLTQEDAVLRSERFAVQSGICMSILTAFSALRYFIILIGRRPRRRHGLSPLVKRSRLLALTEPMGTDFGSTGRRRKKYSSAQRPALEKIPQPGELNSMSRRQNRAD
jgi:hypothetical protein